jgi:hypothetical protein
VTSGEGIARAIELMREMPHRAATPLPTQDVLDGILQSVANSQVAA